MIVGKAELRQAIVDAETLATRIRDDARPLTMPERRTAAHLLNGLAEMARRSFDPYARHDWGVMPRPPRETDDVPGVFDERRVP